MTWYECLKELFQSEIWLTYVNSIQKTLLSVNFHSFTLFFFNQVSKSIFWPDILRKYLVYFQQLSVIPIRLNVENEPYLFIIAGQK